MCTVLSNIKLGHIIRVLNNKSLYSRHYKPLLAINTSNLLLLSNYEPRKFSLQATVESLVRTQTGIFKWLSESSLVECSQKFLLYIHDNSGLPWWATIISTTVLLRTIITLPLAVYQYYILAKLENIKLEMPAIVKEMQKEMAIAIKMYKWDERTAKITFQRSIKKQWTKLIERDNCHPLKTTIIFLFQIPLWISLSVALRNLVYMLPSHSLDSQITFAELSVGGFGFIPNLTVVDSSLIFPVTLGILNLLIVELQCLSRVDPPPKSARIITNLFRGFNLLLIPIAACVPSCVVLYWTASSGYGLIQNLILLSPTMKRLCRIPKTAKELEKPYEHVAQELRKKCNKVIGIK